MLSNSMTRAGTLVLTDFGVCLLVEHVRVILCESKEATVVEFWITVRDSNVGMGFWRDHCLPHCLPVACSFLVALEGVG